jgi:hypothetical protein
MEQAEMADEPRLTKAEADAAVETLDAAVKAADKAIRLAQSASGVNLLRGLNEVSGSFASMVQAIRLRQTAPDPTAEDQIP